MISIFETYSISLNISRIRCSRVAFGDPYFVSFGAYSSKLIPRLEQQPRVRATNETQTSGTSFPRRSQTPKPQRLIYSNQCDLEPIPGRRTEACGSGRTCRFYFGKNSLYKNIYFRCSGVACLLETALLLREAIKMEYLGRMQRRVPLHRRLSYQRRFHGIFRAINKELRKSGLLETTPRAKSGWNCFTQVESPPGEYSRAIP